MSSSPATLPLRLDTQYDEPVLGPEVKGGEMCGEDGGRVDGRAKSLGSRPNTALLGADMPLEHSIQLPIELWEKVIDVLANEWVDVLWRDVTYEARLHVLGRVCREWYARCRFRAWEKLDVDRMDKTEVYRLINALKQNPERCHAIKTVSFHFQWDSALMSIFGTFAVCMAQRLPPVKRLILGRYNWELGQLHAQVFVHITLAFESVAVLKLMEVRFPSAAVFGRLLRALPRLSSLTCWSVSFRKRGDVAGRIWELHPLRLEGADVRDSDDVVNFLVLVGAQLRHLVWRTRSSDKCSELLAVTAESLSSICLELPRFISRKIRFPDFTIDLTPAIHLRVLSFTVPPAGLPGAANVLSRTSLPKLTVIEVRITSVLLGPKSYSSRLENADKDSYGLIDQALSSRHTKGCF
ncbi:uncharacterized protein FIBRA_03114 [Fibroporia radiculosa]|uniref:F-box domain-containing protein n=1 Tax=Fibroporia radiculosa TaxID=599839 RepID=J4I9F4_9APHY|nr:uncharacterized protein FIBRA_03114 [Fibroporia radiculosa]CCM01066.1 predicted protein [Fibroporia radiculosa]